MPTILDYPGVSPIWGHQIFRNGLFGAFLCFSLKFRPFFSQNFFIVWFLGHFCTYLITDKDYAPINVNPVGGRGGVQGRDGDLTNV